MRRAPAHGERIRKKIRRCQPSREFARVRALMRIPFPARVALLLGLGAAVASPAPAQLVSLDVLKGSGYRVVPLTRPRPNILAVEGSVNGKNVRLIVDTGCHCVTLRRSLLPRFGIKTEVGKGEFSGVSGKSEGRYLMGVADRVQVGNVAVTGMPVLFSDLGVFEGRRARTGSMIPVRGGDEADGFLGADYLTACSAVIDLQNLKLYLRAPGTGKRADLGPGLRGVGMTEIPFSNAHRNRYYVKTEINGVSGEMMLDTGDYITALTSRAPGLRAAAFRSPIKAIDITGASSNVSRASLRSFRVGNFPVTTDDSVLLQDMSMGEESHLMGLLGMDVMGRNAGIIDCGQRKLYLIRPR